jgi:hypothetical protein
VTVSQSHSARPTPRRPACMRHEWPGGDRVGVESWREKTRRLTTFLKLLHYLRLISLWWVLLHLLRFECGCRVYCCCDCRLHVDRLRLILRSALERI